MVVIDAKFLGLPPLKLSLKYVYGHSECGTYQSTKLLPVSLGFIDQLIEMSITFIIPMISLCLREFGLRRSVRYDLSSFFPIDL